MNNPSYLGTETRYYYDTRIAAMDTERYDGQTVLHLDDLEIVSEANINNAHGKAAIDVISQLTGKPQPKVRP